jgi:predicted TIM-barrel fold metal-dependent hydrolase
MGFDGTSVIPPAAREFIVSHEARPGAHDIDRRLEDMDAEGIDKEIAFPQLISFMHYHPDFEAREHTFRIYNEYLVELEARAGGRMFGVGIFPNHWDASRADELTDEIIGLGLKTFRLPILAGTGPSGAAVSYMAETMDPLWSAIERSGRPVCFHIGEGVNHTSRPQLAVNMLVAFKGFRQTLGELIFGGVFDRHPGLRVVFAEAQINWVPGALQDAETLYDSYAHLIDPRPMHRPSHYWFEHCYATFMNDAAGLAMLDRIGAERVMWSTDYPHHESTFGYSSRSMQCVLDATSADEATAILGGTATDVFDLS